MFKKALAIFAASFGLVFTVSPTMAQVHTGGSNFTRAGVPPEGEVLMRRGRSGEFGRNHPFVPGSEYAPGYRRGHATGYGHRHGYYGGYRHGGGRVVVVAPGAYQERLIARFGGSIAPRAGAKPVPTPEQIAGMVKHKRTSTPVPCIDGYVKNEANGQCDLVSWTPGPEPE